MREYVKVIGGPLDGCQVEWTRSVVVVERHNNQYVKGWAVQDDERPCERFTYARFSRPSATFYAPVDWTWDQIERAMLDGYKGGR